MSEAFDAIVIGAGQSGGFLAARLAEAGWKTALIERTHIGGTCVNDGCTPTKTMVASARAAWSARHAADFGIVLPHGPVKVDMKAVKARKEEVVGASVKSLTDWFVGLADLELIWGSASFVSPTEITVNGRVLSAHKIFLNPGATANVPDWPGIEDVSYLTNTTIMDLDELPDHLVIAGASYIGLEFAQIYARFGSKVTVIERGSRPASREDEDISGWIRQICEADGVEFIFDATIQSVAQSGGEISISMTAGGKPKIVTGSHLLVAVGRKPNTPDLNLAAAGVDTDARGYIRVDDHLRTNIAGIWAMGDVNGRGAFTHTSYNEFEIVADNVLDGGNRSIAGRIPVYGLFIDPPLGRIGMSEKEARQLGRPVLMGTRLMSKVSRAKERGETQGMMKVLVDAETKRVLGAAILGIGGDEVVHSLLQLMAGDLPYTVMQETVHIHPTVSELLPTLLGSLKPL